MRIKKPTIALSLLLIVLLTSSCSNHTYKSVASDKYRIVWNDDPTSTITIIWDQFEEANQKVYYGKEDFGTEYSKYPLQQAPTRKLLDYYGMNTNYAEIKSLEADQNYYFVIKDDYGTSKRFYFKTAPDKPEPFTFISGGDSKTFEDSYEVTKASNKMVAKLRPLFVLFVGDFTSGNGTYPERWHQWLRDWDTLTTTNDGRKFPIIPIHGNHENGNMTILNKIFNAPFQNSDSSSIYYSLSFGGDFVHIIALNSQIETGGKQREWLENDLKNHEQYRFKIAGYHKPFHPHTAKKGEYEKQYSNWANLFFDNNLSLSVDADAHVHKITYPLRPSDNEGSFQGFIRDDANGTVFIGEGGWGVHPRANNDDKPWTMQSASINQIKWLHVRPEEEESISLEVFTVVTATYENDENLVLHVDDVANLCDSNLFEVPKNIKLFNPDGKTNSVKFYFGKK